jgi:hypothetical protein
VLDLAVLPGAVGLDELLPGPEARESRDSRQPVRQLEAKLSLPVLTAVVHAQDQQHVIRRLEGDDRPALETHDPQARQDIVSCLAKRGCSREHLTLPQNPGDVAVGSVRVALVRNEVSQLEKLTLRPTGQCKLSAHASARRAASDSRNPSRLTAVPGSATYSSWAATTS